MADLVGKTFGHLIVLERAGSQGKGKCSRTLWRCRCVCGKEKVAVGVSLGQGQTTSCGCKGLAQGEGGLNRLFTSYQVRAKKRKIDWSLLKEEFWAQTSKDCFYCGAAPQMLFTSTGLKDRSESDWSAYKYNGLDRVDSNGGYGVKNIVSACVQCNKGKQDRTLDEFLLWVEMLHERFVKEQLGSQRTTIKIRATALSKAIGAYRYRAKRAKRDWLLTDKQVQDIVTSTCYYCGAQPINGIDRVENVEGYVLSNVVPCCMYCNKAKLDGSLRTFHEWIIRVGTKQGVK